MTSFPDSAPARLRSRPALSVPPLRVPESHEALPERLQRSRLVEIGMRGLQAACIVYAVVLLFWVWMCQDLALSYLATNFPLYTYAILVTSYWLCRFLLAGLYRPTADAGLRPTVAIIIPAFNEEDCIEATIDACYETSYPTEKLEVVAVDDGSSDGTWAKIQEARRRHPSLVAIAFGKNRGKRAAMAEGVRRSTSEICVFVDSDSVIEPDGLNFIMADFVDPRVGCVVGSAEILNKYESWITRMQQVRYFVAFRVIKGSESVFGAVTCASGCFSVYRRSALLPILDEWEEQRFLGRPATYGDDRALTNCVLPNWRVTYQSRARPFVPIYLYSATRTDGYLISDQIRAVIDAPSTIGFDQLGFGGAAALLLIGLLAVRPRLEARALRLELDAAPQQVKQTAPLLRAAGR